MVSRHQRRRKEEGERERPEYDSNRRLAYRRCDLLLRRHPGFAAVELARADVLLLAAEGVPRPAVLARLWPAVADLVSARPAATKHFSICTQQEVELTANAEVTGNARR